MALLLGFMLLTFVGTHPFGDTSVASRSDGNIGDRIAVMSLFGLSLYVLWSNGRRAMATIVANIPFLLVIGFCVASILWSDYPALTLRRGLLLFFLTTIALGVAVGVTDARRLHTILFVTLTSIVLLNLAAAIIVPSIAISNIGMNGLYTQKNVAGAVAMITLILGATWIAGETRPRYTTIAVLALVPTIIFLVLTRSRTSINLAALGTTAVVCFALIERYRAPFIIGAAVFSLLAASGLLVWLAVYDFDFNLALASVVGDTSFSGRDELWAFSRLDAEKRMWLGHGYGAFWDVGVENDPLVRAEPGSWLGSVAIGVINQAHHGYLELWLHIGLPMTIIASLAVGYAAAIGWFRAVLGPGDRQTRALVCAMATLLSLHLFHNLTEATLFMRGAPFWNMATLAVFLISQARIFAGAEKVTA